MFPILFEPFGFPISTFGVMMVLGFLAGTWISKLRMREFGLDPEIASTLLLYCMAGGVLGAKLYFAIDVSLRTDHSFLTLFLSREGMTWYGGLIGGTLACLLGCKFHHVPVRIWSSSACIGAAVGQALGRIGCFLVGDDYGHATSLPWGIAFPKGAPPTDLPVHPTQIYEFIWLIVVAIILWRRRHKSPFLFGEYVAANGLGRIVIESFRLNPVVAFGLTEPQWIGLGLVVFGIIGYRYFRSRPLAAKTGVHSKAY